MEWSNKKVDDFIYTHNIIINTNIITFVIQKKKFLLREIRTYVANWFIKKLHNWFFASLICIFYVVLIVLCTGSIVERDMNFYLFRLTSGG